MHMQDKLKKATWGFVADKKEYFRNWLFDYPIVISKNRNDKLERLQQIMFKFIAGFVTNYLAKYQSAMPLNTNELQVIEVFNNSDSYSPGTYRTDFVYDNQGHEKLIEITCRFSLNSVFESSVFHEFSKEFVLSNTGVQPMLNEYENIFTHLSHLIGDKRQIIILKGSDLKNSSRVFKGIFLDAGLEVREIIWSELSSHHQYLKKAFVISELTLDEIVQLDKETLKVLSECHLINDFRTVLLIHDKRFFSVLYNEQIQQDLLTIEERAFLKPFLIPTYNYLPESEEWKDAKDCKDRWILKHRALGKSKSIYAGPVTRQKEWDDIMLSAEIHDYILQKWIPQQTVKGNLRNESHDDFITGTLMYFDNYYFGLGPFRTSSHPVTNVVDDRKAFYLALEKPSTVPNEKSLMKLE